jgi:hypothetical protein
MDNGPKSRSQEGNQTNLCFQGEAFPRWSPIEIEVTFFCVGEDLKTEEFNYFETDAHLVQ